MEYSVQFDLVPQSCPTLCDPMDCSTPGLPVHHQLPELAQTHVHWVSDAIQPSHPLLSPSPPDFNLSQHQGLPNESVLSIRWPKYWSFSISPSNEYSGLISFRMDWLDLLPVQGTLKSLLQHHSSKASILQHSAFFIVQLSHPYMTTGKTIALTRRTFVGKVISLLFNMLSRLVITFLPRSKRLLISWLQSPSAVILEPKKIKFVTVSTVSPSICHAVAAKSRQSCPTLCDPIDGSPPGSPIPGILQAKILEWVAIYFSNACMHAKSLQLCPTLCDPMDSSPPGSSVHRIL